MNSLDRYDDVKMKCVKLFEPACWRTNRKAANMKKSHFHPGVEAANVAWDFGNVQMLCCSLLFGPEHLVSALSHNSVITNSPVWCQNADWHSPCQSV